MGGEGTVTRRLTFPPFRFFFGRVGGGGTATLRLVTPWIILPLQHNLFRHSLMLLYLKDLNVCSDKAKFSFLQKKTAFWCSFKCIPNWMFLGGGLVRLSMLLTSALTKCLLSLLSWEMLSSTAATISAVGILRGASNVSLVHVWKSIKKRFSFAKKKIQLYRSTHAWPTIHMGGISLKLSPLIGVTTSAFVWKPGTLTSPTLL